MQNTEKRGSSLAKRICVVANALLFTGAAALFLVAPLSAHAASTTSGVGAGNALVHAITGISHASSTSDIVDHLNAIVSRGGKPPTVTPPHQHGNSGDNQNDGDHDTPGNGTPDGGTGTPDEAPPEKSPDAGHATHEDTPRPERGLPDDTSSGDNETLSVINESLAHTCAS